MRVLLLVDNLNSAARSPQVGHDLTLLATRLDRARIQLAVCALRAPTSDLVDTSLGAKSRFSLLAVRRLAALLTELDIELLHIMEPGALICGVLAARMRGVPTLLSYTDGITVTANPLRRQVRRLLWQAIAWAVQRLIVSSEVTRQALTDLVKFRTGQIVVLYEGKEFRLDGPTRASLGLPEGPLLAMIVSGESDEGHELVFDVLHRLMKRQPDVHLAVIGGGPAASELQKKAAQFRPALPIRWLGEREDVPALLAAADVVLDTGLRERLPEGLIYGALLGRPLVAQRIAGVTEIIEPNVSGLLVTAGDAADMAVQINRLLQYEGLSSRLGRMAQRRAAERFSSEAQRKAMTELYEATIYATR